MQNTKQIIHDNELIGKHIEVKEKDGEQDNATIVDMNFYSEKSSYIYLIIYDDGQFCSRFSFRCTILKSESPFNIKSSEDLIGKRIKVKYKEEDGSKKEGEGIIRAITFDYENTAFQFLVELDAGRTITTHGSNCSLLYMDSLKKTII